MPVGIALYVYGGGWNRQDTGSGNTAMHILSLIHISWYLAYSPQD